jgi:putative transposase
MSVWQLKCAIIPFACDFQLLAVVSTDAILRLMLIASGLIAAFSHAATTFGAVLVDLGRFLALCFQSRAALAAENLFLRKQLALFEERNVKSQRATDGVRFVMAALGRLFDWRHGLRVVKPDTFVRWHRKGFRLF